MKEEQKKFDALILYLSRSFYLSLSVCVIFSIVFLLLKFFNPCLSEKTLFKIKEFDILVMLTNLFFLVLLYLSPGLFAYIYAEKGERVKSFFISLLFCAFVYSLGNLFMAIYKYDIFPNLECGAWTTIICAGVLTVITGAALICSTFIIPVRKYGKLRRIAYDIYCISMGISFHIVSFIFFNYPQG